MLNRYNSTIAPKAKEFKKGPSKETLDFILNYSKSTEVKKKEQQGLVLFLN